MPVPPARIVAEGKRLAQQSLERVRRTYRWRVRTLECAFPQYGVAVGDAIEAYCGERRDGGAMAPTGRLVRGDGLLALATLLEDFGAWTLRGRVDFLYAGATDVASGAPNAAEIAALAARLVLLREMLAADGTLWVRSGPSTPPAVAGVLEALFGRARRVDAGAGVDAGGTLQRFGKRVAVDAQRPPGGAESVNGAPRAAPADAALREEARWERLLAAHSRPGALVVDVSGASAALALAAQRLGRRWTVCAAAPQCAGIRKRLVDHGVAPFVLQVADEDRLHAAVRGAVRRAGAGGTARHALAWYGARPLRGVAVPAPLAAGELPPRGGSRRRTLVVVDSPSRRTGAAMLKRALAQRDAPHGRWDGVVVLGWRFESGLAERVAALNDVRVGLFVLAPELLDEVAGDVADVVPLRRLGLQAMRREEVPCAHGNRCYERVVVRLESYAPLPFTARIVAAGGAEGEADPLARIAAWAVDPDYDGECFHAVWQDHRGSRANGGDPARLAVEARLVVPYRDRARCICVRSIDVHGVETQVVRLVGGGASPSDGA